MPSPLHLFLPIAPPSLALISCCSFFDLDLDRQPPLHHAVNLLLAGFPCGHSAVQDVMTGINDESTTLSTKTASTGNAAGQVRLEDGDDGAEVGMCGGSLCLLFPLVFFSRARIRPRCTATPTESEINRYWNVEHHTLIRFQHIELFDDDWAAFRDSWSEAQGLSKSTRDGDSTSQFAAAALAHLVRSYGLRISCWQPLRTFEGYVDAEDRRKSRDFARGILDILPILGTRLLLCCTTTTPAPATTGDLHRCAEDLVWLADEAAKCDPPVRVMYEGLSFAAHRRKSSKRRIDPTSASAWTRSIPSRSNGPILTHQPGAFPPTWMRSCKPICANWFNGYPVTRSSSTKSPMPSPMPSFKPVTMDLGHSRSLTNPSRAMIPMSLSSMQGGR
ncbi:BQ5605_C003g02191 [Microbotryum silenes-dioicae]|uniref:BQ5605_C003g02191 protein n=1 Tax=Microbotryum silenes-dioicae TaxID=796604 RepID=A0A2X0P3R4_9BASI|nr:BQ5605_C003g02191 [Microbotryum silenes-dioicae]